MNASSSHPPPPPSTSPTIRSTKVTFSEYSELFLYSIPSDYDKSTSWYSAMERERFRQSMVDDALQAAKEINDLPPVGNDIATITHHHEQQLCKCIGIETFIGKDVARSTQRFKRMHVAAILSEQRLQKQNGEYDIWRLSDVSCRWSHRSADRARKLALGYAAIALK